MIVKFIAYWLIVGLLVFIGFVFMLFNANKKSKEKIGKITNEDMEDITSQSVSMITQRSEEETKTILETGDSLLSNLTDKESVKILISSAICIIAWPYTLKLGITINKGINEFIDYKSHDKESK